MKYVIRKRCAYKITAFYRNVSKKYKHTYSLELMEKNVIDDTDKWYYAYTIDGDTVTVVDACHAQNMHDKSVLSPTH